MSTNTQGKLANYVNYRMKVELNHNCYLIGQMLAFDKHMNLVLAECEEFRKVKQSNAGAPGSGSKPAEVEEKRSLGLCIVRGKNVVHLSVESPPPADPSARLGGHGSSVAVPPAAAAGPGIARPAGRTMQVGLAGPAAMSGPPGAFPPGAAPPFPPPGFPARGAPNSAPFPPAGGPPGFSGALPPGFGGAPGFPSAPGFPPPGQGRGFPPPPPGGNR